MDLKVDVHTHILPKNWPRLKDKYGYGGWIEMHHCHDGLCDMKKDTGEFFRKIEENSWSPHQRKMEMKKVGVDIQVLSTVPVMFSYWAKPQDTADLSRFLNNHIAEIVNESPDKFIAMATVPLQAPLLAVEELKRCVMNLGLNGVQIGSHVNEWNLDDPKLFPFYKTAQDLDVPIFVHPWDMEQSPRMSKYWLPWLVGMPSETTIAICSFIFGGVFDHFPKLKVCFSHGAGSFPYTAGRIQRGYEVRKDLCNINEVQSPLNYLGQIYSDSLVHEEQALKLLTSILGEDNIMMGSDYPFPLGEEKPGELIENAEFLSKSQKSKMLGSNALKFFGVEDRF